MSELAIDQNQVAKASTALMTYLKKNREVPKNQLFEDEVLEKDIFLVVGTKTVSSKLKLKPIRIPLKTPIFSEETSVCLITKDPSTEYVKKAKSGGLKFVEQVLGVSELKKQYKPYEAKRMLLESHQLFMVDDRVLPALPKLVGSKFFQKKKQPVPVNLATNEFTKEIKKALSSTYFHFSRGTTLSIKIGSTRMTSEQLCENILHALPYIIKRIPKNSKNVKMLAIKSSDSVALPIYNDIEQIKKRKQSSGEEITLDTQVSTDENTKEKQPKKAKVETKQEAAKKEAKVVEAKQEPKKDSKVVETKKEPTKKTKVVEDKQEATKVVEAKEPKEEPVEKTIEETKATANTPKKKKKQSKAKKALKK
ncbi:hypothetical protein BB559_002550 [Furculomyces boomerangus]|uniref:Ribosomal protein L1 n=1 Tax=Furculomyces boomerangus TaxID=61424 RepID=A0A2T9YUD9_9FUNG|nr:hypothetical protein BB559_002550 [Furculomyces boomerangus]